MSAPKGYSSLQIHLHWVVAILIVAQFVFAEGIEEAWRAFEEGGAAVFNFMVGVHVVGGVLVGAFALWRIKLRRSRGVPDAPEHDPALQKLAAHLTHLALYGLMILLPISGMAAWFGGVLVAGEVHQLLKMALIVLVLLHVLAVLYHQFVVKDGLLARMKRPLD